MIYCCQDNFVRNIINFLLSERTTKLLCTFLKVICFCHFFQDELQKVHLQAANQDLEFKQVLVDGLIAIHAARRGRALAPEEEEAVLSTLKLQLELERRNLPSVDSVSWDCGLQKEHFQAANQDPAFKQLLTDGIVAIEARREGKALSPAEEGVVKANLEEMLAEDRFNRLKASMKSRNSVYMKLLKKMNRRKAREEQAILDAARADLEQARIDQIVAERDLEEERALLMRLKKEELINKNMKVLTIAPSENEAVKLAIPIEGDPKTIEANDAACLICMEPYKNGADLGLLKCDHHADRACLKNWLHFSNSCPMCRKPAW